MNGNVLTQENWTKKIHDGILRAIDINYEKSEVSIDLTQVAWTEEEKPHAGRLVFKDFMGLTVPNLRPWGKVKSIQILGAKVVEKTFGKLISIELQTGDIIEIQCKSILIEDPV